MSTTPGLPQPLTPESLQGLMRERAYWNPSDPRFPTYQRLVKRGFEILYPGSVRRDDTGIMIDTPPLPPERVAHLVAQTNREIDAAEGGFDEKPSPGGDGAVHVEAHTRAGGKVEVSDYWRAPPGQGADGGAPESRNDPGQGAAGADRSLPSPDTREPVDPNDFYRKMDFDPNGKKEWEAALRRPLEAHQASELASEAREVTKREYPGIHPHDNEADAFRHAYWSFETARKIGPDAAKEFGDAHERSDSNPTLERLMDLYNNKVGRDLAADPKNAGRDGREVIREAIRDGKLRTRPLETDEPRSLLPDRPPGMLYR